MSQDFKKVVLILQGPAISKEQLYQDLKKYHQMGFHQIIVSTYSEFIHPEIQFPVIENDKVGKNKLRTNFRGRPKVAFSFDDKEKIKFVGLQNSLFYQVTTTKRGIQLANLKYPEAKFYLKIRCDMFFMNADDRIRDWMTLQCYSNQEKTTRNLYRGKILSFRCYKNKAWYLTDYTAFGLKEDLEKYYSFQKCWQQKKPELNKEKRIAISSLKEHNPQIEWKSGGRDFFLTDETMQLFWHKADRIMPRNHPKFSNNTNYSHDISRERSRLI